MSQVSRSERSRKCEAKRKRKGIRGAPHGSPASARLTRRERKAFARRTPPRGPGTQRTRHTRAAHGRGGARSFTVPHTAAACALFAKRLCRVSAQECLEFRIDVRDVPRLALHWAEVLAQLLGDLRVQVA